ncbi:MAG: hypothetical protein SGARI_002790 [Bacillariaceae sp.]
MNDDGNNGTAPPRPDETPSLNITTDGEQQPRFFFQQKIGEQQQEIAALKKERKALLQKCNAAETQTQELKKEVARWEASYEFLEAKRDSLEAQVRKLKGTAENEALRFQMQERKAAKRKFKKERTKLKQKFKKRKKRLERQITQLQRKLDAQDGTHDSEEEPQTKKQKQCEEDDEDQPSDVGVDSSESEDSSDDQSDESSNEDFIKDLTVETLQTYGARLPGALHSMCDTDYCTFIQWGEDGKSVHVDVNETKEFYAFLKQHYRDRRTIYCKGFESYLGSFKSDLRLFGFSIAVYFDV